MNQQLKPMAVHGRADYFTAGRTKSSAESRRGKENSAAEDPLEARDVVDHTPLGSARLAHALLQEFDPAAVAARIDVVGIELGDIERHHANAGQVHGDVADGLLVELLLHVGEDEDGLAAGAGLVQELRRLEQDRKST